MATFSIRTDNNSTYLRKPRVYFTCHPDDFGTYFDKICKDVFKTHDCAIYYTENMTEEISAEDQETFLQQMNVFIIPVTYKLLTTPNRAMDADFEYAKSKNVHILPIMFENGINEFYSKQERFGKLQYLSPYNSDITEITYEEKLKKYLDSVLISDEMASRIRAAFDAYIFLSYRKKDRKYANELIKLVHRDPEYHHIAIWYDEFLTPGESFQDNIKRMIEKSKIFTLLVTPSLLEEPNFILDKEYPVAKDLGKKILPAEMVKTDRELLHSKYKDLPSCINVYDEDDFKIRFLETVKKIATSTNDCPEHNFLIGLAYFEGIDVETDRERALALFHLAAEQNLPEAIEKLYDIYIDRNTYQTSYPKAIKWAERLVALYEGIYGKEHTKTLGAIGRLAYVYNLQGSHRDALPLNETLHASYVKIHGESHPDTLLALNNLAYTLDKCGLSQRALEKEDYAYGLCLKLFGEMNRDTLLALNTLAATHNNLGHYEIALKLKEKAYNISCELYGKNNPATLRALNTLAVTYDDLGDYDSAIALKKTAYELRVQILGEEHLDTITTLHNLAVTYGNCGNCQEEAAIEERVYRLRCRILGENHPDTLTTLNNLSVTYKDLGDYRKALELSKEAYVRYRDTLGEKHPFTIRGLSNLSVVYGKLKDYDLALKLGYEAYELRREVLGATHPKTLITLCNLADIYYDMGMYSEAADKYRTVYTLRREILRDNHPDTVEAKKKLFDARSRM